MVVSLLIIRLLRCHRYSSLSRRCRCSWTSERDSGLRIYSSLQGACLASNPFLHASLARTRTLDFWRHWLAASIPAPCSLTLRVCICRPHALLPRLFPACPERRRLAMVGHRARRVFSGTCAVALLMRCCTAHAFALFDGLPDECLVAHLQGACLDRRRAYDPRRTAFVSASQVRLQLCSVLPPHLAPDESSSWTAALSNKRLPLLWQGDYPRIALDAPHARNAECGVDSPPWPVRATLLAFPPFDILC